MYFRYVLLLNQKLISNLKCNWMPFKLLIIPLINFKVISVGCYVKHYMCYIRMSPMHVLYTCALLATVGIWNIWLKLRDSTFKLLQKYSKKINKRHKERKKESEREREWELQIFYKNKLNYKIIIPSISYYNNLI